MSFDNPISELLAAPLGPSWTVDALAEQVLGMIATQKSEGQEFVLDEISLADRQSRRLLRPLLACFATKSAQEDGSPVNLYGGQLAFKRSSSEGAIWILGRFENRPGSVRVTLRRSSSPPPISEPRTGQVAAQSDAASYSDPSQPATGSSQA